MNSSTKVHYAPHKTKCGDTGSVWFNFLIADNGEPTAKCKTCDKVLKTNGGSTKGLLVHLQTHNIIKEAERDSQTKCKIPHYFSVKNEDTFMAAVARLTALDGLPFSKFITSEELRKSLKACGFNVPKSAESIKQQMMEFFFKCRQNVVEEITALKDMGKKFSLVFDEWTSTANKRYLNIIVHGKNKFFNISLVRLKNSATAAACLDALTERLNAFNLSLSTDIVAITTDGASAMVKLGKNIPPTHQLCFAHTIQLAVIDVFYKKPILDTPALVVFETDSDEEVDFYDGIAVCQDRGFSEFSENCNIKRTIEQVRKIVRIFRKTPTKTDILQKYVRYDHGKELN
ncbi:PREDICTED: uncharacterized protein LOC108383020 [Rhagoletis zephyria]|uniref:uncharacterized protein LOC108383020 n=1 Tax=Rhagoletis zephyria TaxID=28612 RepID=UPI0008112119|nr:PREDICTED: uncharacterized protein LOC108383020 [Rhagoletis zephyria]